MTLQIYCGSLASDAELYRRKVNHHCIILGWGKLIEEAEA